MRVAVHGLIIVVLITNGETSMSGIAASVILGLVEVGAQLISGYQQNKALVEGQEEARALNENQLAESHRIEAGPTNKGTVHIRHFH